MKTIAIHSHKGGVGKTTVALLLAKAATSAGRKTCVADFDFIGSGMTDLFALERKPRHYLDYYFLDTAPDAFEIEHLMGRYADGDLGRREMLVMCNLGDGLPGSRTHQADEDARQRQEMFDLVASEPRYREIQVKTEVLYRRLGEEHEVDLLIIDCHPGLGFVSETVRSLADLNVYVTTPNRSDCFGLLRSINAMGLDGPEAFLIVNRAEAAVIDAGAFRRLVERDPLVGVQSEAIFPQLEYLARNDRHFATIPESHLFRRLLYLGESGHLPPIDPQSGEFAFISKVLKLV